MNNPTAPMLMPCIIFCTQVKFCPRSRYKLTNGTISRIADKKNKRLSHLEYNESITIEQINDLAEQFVNV